MINMLSMVLNSRVNDVECHVNEVWYDMQVGLWTASTCIIMETLLLSKS